MHLVLVKRKWAYAAFCTEQTSAGRIGGYLDTFRYLQAQRELCSFSGLGSSWDNIAVTLLTLSVMFFDFAHWVSGLIFYVVLICQMLQDNFAVRVEEMTCIYTHMYIIICIYIYCRTHRRETATQAQTQFSPRGLSPSPTTSR